MNPSFTARLADLRQQKGSVLCVGIDPDAARLPLHMQGSSDPVGTIVDFCRTIIEATSDHAVAFKINFAFFERLGPRAFDAIASVIEVMPDDVLTIADAKRGDIGNSASFYAGTVFDHFGFDSITISPYMGRDSIEPFFTHPGTCSFVLARTSNPGGSDFQNLEIDGAPLYERVATDVVSWSADWPADAGLVVGATRPQELSRLRALLPDTPFLIPGVGAQGGNAQDVMTAAGSGPVLVNSSRGVLYAGIGDDFADAARKAAAQTKQALGS